MFIKFDEYEVLSFFENAPIVIGDYEEGNWIYSITKNDFKMTMLVATYEEYIELSLSYKDNIVCKQRFGNISEIAEMDYNCLRITTSENKRIILKKEIQLGVIVE
jgi:hypothetical protein